MKWLENFSLVRINIISSILATTILLVIAGLLVVYEQSDRDSAQRNIAFLEVLKALDDVAHNHAVERGLTAGFLGIQVMRASLRLLHSASALMRPIAD